MSISGTPHVVREDRVDAGVSKEAAAAAARDLTTTLDAQRDQLVRRVYLGAALLALVYAPVLAWRVSDVGWTTQFRVHAAYVALGLALPLVIHRLPLRLRAGLMVLLFALLGGLGLFNLGMAGTGYWWLYQGAWLVAVLFSARWGLIFSVAITALVAGVGAAFVSGALVPAVDLNVLATSASAWAAFVVAIFFASMILLLAFSGYQATTQALIAEVTAQRNELARAAAHDQLTGLPLLRLATDRLEMALHAARRAQDKVAVMFIDLDGFKAVNDRQGHETGNQVLREIGARLQHAVRAQDTVARVGGDEFVIVLGQLKDAQAAVPIARKLLADIAQPVAMGDITARVGASIGIALFPDHGETAVDLLREADHAMYAVKHSGRNGFGFARPAAR